jgi:hypothetical protein
VNFHEPPVHHRTERGSDNPVRPSRYRWNW